MISLLKLLEYPQIDKIIEFDDIHLGYLFSTSRDDPHVYIAIDINIQYITCRRDDSGIDWDAYRGGIFYYKGRI